MSFQKLMFNLSADGFGSVTLDGKPIECRSISFHQEAGKLAEVTLTICAQVEASIEIDAERMAIKGDSE